MKKLLISHIDLDGSGSIVLERAYRDKLGFDQAVMLDYDFELNPENQAVVESFDEIIIADLSIREEYFAHLASLGKKVRIFDHHASASYLDEYRGCVHDETRCGTRIFFEEYVAERIGRAPQVVFDFVDRIDTYDRWQDESPLWEEALSLNRVLYGFTDYSKKGMEASEAFLRTQARKLMERDEWGWTPTEVQAIERSREAEDRRFQEAVDTISCRKDSRGLYFGVFAIPGKISIVCSRLLKDPRYAFLDYVIVTNSYGGVSGNLSLRSRNGFDCTALGPVNGHLAAAGGKIEPEQAKLLLKDETYSLAYKEDEGWNKDGNPLVQHVEF